MDLKLEIEAYLGEIRINSDALDLKTALQIIFTVQKINMCFISPMFSAEQGR